MDDLRFDRLARSLAHAAPRRAVARALLGAATGGLVAALGPAADAKAARCKKDDDCTGCRTCDRKKRRCVKGCAKGRRCRDGLCVAAGRTCASQADCGACESCSAGACAPDPAKDGQGCGGCLVCANGTCGIPSNDRCADNEICRPATGTCCAECLDGRCCRAGEVCIDPGAFAANSCCDTERNTPCGSNGDGTFAQCCSNRNEECCGGECVPKGECCRGGRRAGGSCCPPNTISCGNDCCDSRTQRCHEGQCRETCSTNTTYTSPCDDGVNHWCCRPEFSTCCYMSGNPHCCRA